MGWRESIVEALTALGGEADLADIYAKTQDIRTRNGDSVPPTYKETIQGTIERHSSDSENWKEGRPNLFAKMGRGRWALRTHPMNLPAIGPIPAGITRDDVLLAIKDLDEGLEHGFGDSTRYDLIHDGKRYPPKAVLGLAARRELGRPMKASEFHGGERSASFQVLRLLGFEIERKPGAVELPDRAPPVVWIENTKTSHNHGGKGWEFSTCIWSPSTDSGGGDRYPLMREVREGDLVLHVNDSEFVGFSYAAGSFQETPTPPPEPGEWAGRASYYRVPLQKYTEFPIKVSIANFLARHRDAIRAEIEHDHPKRFLFVKEASGIVKTGQGAYLTRCTGKTYQRIRSDVYGLDSYSAADDVLCLLGSSDERQWRDVADDFIRRNGAWASPWSFVVRDEPAHHLQKPFYLYINAGGGRFRTRLRCEDFKSMPGASGFATPWPEITESNKLERSSGTGDRDGQAYKTWFKVTAIDSLDPPLSLEDFAPANPWSRPENILNQNAFGYAYRAVADLPVESVMKEPYSLNDALQDLFVSEELLKEMHFLLGAKKNLILQGSPGVGKTYVAKRLAYALCGYKSKHYVETVQFHQSYAYEDFVQGFRPRSGHAGGFERKDGVFYRFCERARQDPGNKYVFVIDEINRGNLSKIFGELMLLIEADKRGPEWEVALTYSDENSPRFSIPDNLHILGLMNTADRSLALVDYALRRRFAFITVPPAFTEATFANHLKSRDVPDDLTKKIIDRFTKLNRMIADDHDLGDGFLVGHSYFCQRSSDELVDSWYQRIIRTEIAPLLREYWFDKKKEDIQDIVAGLT